MSFAFAANQNVIVSLAILLVGCVVALAIVGDIRKEPSMSSLQEVSESAAAPSFREWAIVEVMGHQRFAGEVTEQAIGGASFIRVDVPAVDDRPAFTKLLGSSSIFAITPCDEGAARAAAESFRSRAVSCFMLPASEPASVDGEWFE